MTLKNKININNYCIFVAVILGSAFAIFPFHLSYGQNDRLNVTHGVVSGGVQNNSAINLDFHSNMLKQLVDILTSKELIASYIGSSAAITPFLVYYFEKKQKQQNLLNEIISMLENNRNRNARRRVSHLEHEQTTRDKRQILEKMNAIKSDDSDAKVEAFHLESKNMVKGDYNYIGLLYIKNLIPRETFIELYWHSIIRCWQILEWDIKRERERGNLDSHCQYFEELKNKAFEYKKKPWNYVAEEYEILE